MLVCWLGGCASQQQPASFSGPSEACETVYVYAPGNFLVDLAAGARVSLDPSVRQFPIFCSAKAARTAVNAAVQRKELPAGDWQIYSLNGGYQDLGTAIAPTTYVLAKPADMAEWIPD